MRLRSWQADTGAKTLAFAADHGALVDAFTRLAEATGEARWIGAAVDTAEALLGLFWDDEGGGVFTTGHDGEQLITRAKDLLDNATPSASSLAAVALLRLGSLTGIDRYSRRGEAILELLGAVAGQHPTAFGHLLYAIELAANPAEARQRGAQGRGLVLAEFNLQANVAQLSQVLQRTNTALGSPAPQAAPAGLPSSL